MNIYERIKETVTVPQAAERYGLKVGRNGMVNCLFHDDRHPSMKLNERYYYCFGCGARGDVIDLTKRLLGVDTQTAVSILCKDFCLDTGQKSDKPPGAKYPAITKLRQDEMTCVAVLTEFLHLLRQWKIQYAPRSPDASLDDHYILACQQMETTEYALDLLTIGTLDERTTLVDEFMRTGTIERLRRMMDALRGGDRDDRQNAD